MNTPKSYTDWYETMYLDYFNNFLTVQAFADYYGISKDKALIVIETGRKLNDRKARSLDMG